MERDIVALGAEIDRIERAEKIGEELDLPTSPPIRADLATAAARKPVTATAEYMEDFVSALRGRRAAHNVLEEGSAPNGGYLVPDEFERRIVTDLAPANVFRQIANVIRTSSERKIPVTATHSVAAWTAENAAYPESQPTFAQKTLDAYKLADLVRVSIELLQDSLFSIDAFLASEFARAFGAEEERAFCVGTGSGQPTGLFTAQGGSVGVTAGSATAITADNMVDLVYSLLAPYRRNAAFLTSDATVAALRKLKDTNGQYMWQPSLQQGEPARLLGYPLYTTPYAPAVAAGALVVAFGDFSYYWVAERMGRTMQRLNELYSASGQVGFICTERLDGKVVMADGIKLLKMA
jgi:HK97 family phage major capsid protein